MWRINSIEILVAFTIVLNVNLSWQADSPPKVARISDEKQFESILKGKQNVFVYFHYEKAVLGDRLIELAEEVYPECTIAFVYCEKGGGKKLCESVGIKEKPFELRSYRKGVYVTRYTGKYEVEDMKEFVLTPISKVDLPKRWDDSPDAYEVVHIRNEAQFIELVKRGADMLVVFYVDDCPHCTELKPILNEISREKRGLTLIAAIDAYDRNNAPMVTLYKIDSFPTIEYFSRGAHLWRYEGKLTKTDILDYLRNPKPPAIPDKVNPPEIKWSKDADSKLIYMTSDEHFQDFIKKNDHVLAFFYAPWCGHSKHLKPTLENVIRRSTVERSKVVIVAIDGTEIDKTRQKYKVTAYPTLKFFENGEEKYDLRQRLEEELMQWTREPRDITVAKKQPPPPPPPALQGVAMSEWSSEPSAVVHLKVGDFDDHVPLKKHAFIMFYAPWCGHCKNAKPEWQQTAEELKSDDSILIGAVDCTTQAALCQRFGVGAYPKMKYFFDGEFMEDYREARSKHHYKMYLKGKQQVENQGHIEL